jgi:hypothetical protein
MYSISGGSARRRRSPATNAKYGVGTDDEAGGYGNSEMRKYLTPVDDDPATGNFFNGLKQVGVPEDVV